MTWPEALFFSVVVLGLMWTLFWVTALIYARKAQKKITKEWDQPTKLTRRPNKW